MFQALFGLAALLAAQQSFPIPPLPERSARTQSYVIEAELSDDASRITGKATIELRNASPAPIPEVQLHLYWNGFKNSGSTWLHEQARVGRRPSRKVRSESYGACDVRTLRITGVADAGAAGVAGSTDLLPNARFIAPDDGNPDDETVLRAELPQPIPPGGRAVLETTFECTVPRVIARAGRKDDFLLVAHWYPKLGVWESQDDGAWRWNCHQFHANTEFFGEYASYDVTLVVPPRYEKKLGATGVLREGPRPLANGKVAYRFVQDDVHEFAWTADPLFVVERRRFVAAEADVDARFKAEKQLVQRATGLSDEALALSDVEVTILLQPEHADQADRHFRAVSAALRYMGLWHGRYPYATLTVVDPRWGSGSGGMEYPTLITAGTRIDPDPRGFSPEGVTVHEFCHQFFYGLVGSNELENAWMDEGFTSYSAARVLDAAYGDEWVSTEIGRWRFGGRPLVAFPEAKTGLEKLLTLKAFAAPTLEEREGLEVLPDDAALRVARDAPFLAYVDARSSPIESLRSSYLAGAPQADRLARAAFTYVDGGSYRTNAYSKPATLLATLERVIGREPWARAMRAYASRYRFQHPRPEDFFRTIVNYSGSEEAGLPLRAFFDQTFGGSGLLDYAVLTAKTEPVAARAGLVGGSESRKLVAESRSNDSFESTIVVGRKGDVVFPVEIEWKRAGEAPQRATWDGADRWWRRVLESGPRLEWVRVDPDRKLLLDADRLNNDVRVEGDGRAAMRWTLRALLGVESEIAFFGSIR